MSAYPTPLTPNLVQPAMQTLTAVALGLVTLPLPVTIPQSVYGTVRVGWQRRGQPFNAATDEVVYLRADLMDDPPVNRQRDTRIVPNESDPGYPSNPSTVLRIFSYMRVWQTFWEFYGPQESFDRARQLHSAFFTQQIHDTFAALNLNLYWVPDTPSPQRVPYYSDGEWWERTDFSARFNEWVVETTVVPLAASVEIKTYESTAGEIDDFTVPLGSPLLGNYLVQEDGVSRLALEDDSGYLFLEQNA